MHIKTENDNELVDAMSDAVLRVGDGCTVTNLRRWFTSAEIRRCGDAAVIRAYDKRVLEKRAAA